MAYSPEQAARFADRIVYDGRTAERITTAQRANMPPDGAERIAEYIFADALQEN